MTDNTLLNADDGMKMPLGKKKLLRELIEDAWYDAPSASAGFGRIEVIIEQQIKARTNAEIAKLLDRLESNMRGKTVVDTADGWKEFIRKHVNGAIEAERIKLQAGGDWQGIAILIAMKLKESK